MKAILPGRPQSRRQAVCTAHWDGLRLVAYISGNTVVILRDPKDIVQTISINHVENLHAISIEESSGRLALCNKGRVIVFNAVGRDIDDLRWTQSCDIVIPDNGTARSLSWGSDEELLVGGSQLWLYHLPYSDKHSLIWQQHVANEIVMAHFSDDAELIATCGQHDKLVKIWRRLSFERDSTRFDVSYLPHPAAVTNLHWRKPWHEEQNLDSLLYTFCSDNQVRAWCYSDSHSLSVMQLIATIDTNVSIEPRRRSFGSLSRKRFVSILDSRDFSNATEKAIQQSQNQEVDHALEHLIEIANRSPELCVIFDGLGHMSVWGLENAGYKNKKPTVVFNIALVDNVDIQLSFRPREDEDYTQICAFGGGSTPASLSILVHTFTGQIDWYESPITHFFDTSSRNDRVKLVSCWSGHDLSIDHIARGFRGDRILSWTDEGQVILWSQSQIGALRRKCECDIQRNTLSVILFDLSGHLLVLHPDAISLWDVRSPYGKEVATISLDHNNHPSSLQRVGSVLGNSKRRFLVVFENGTQELWQAELATGEGQVTAVNGVSSVFQKLSASEMRSDKNLRVVPCDVASGQRAGVVDPRETRGVLVDNDGSIKIIDSKTETSSVKDGHRNTFYVQTNIQNSALARASSAGKCALVSKDKKCLTIWDLEQGFCEWRYEHDGLDEIQKLVWTSTSRGNSFLLVCFSYHAIVVGQFRYPATLSHQDAWYVTSKISLRDFTTIHVGDVCWLSSGDAVVSAGNQIFVLENLVTEHDSPILRRSEHIVESKSGNAVVDLANSILPVFHADFLEALILESGPRDAENILQRLYNSLKYFSEGDEIASDLGLTPSSLLPARHDVIKNGAAHTNGDIDVDAVLLEDVASSFLEYLDKSEIWQVGPKKRKKIADVVGNLIKISRHQNSLDRNALRYLYMLYQTPEHEDLQWRAFVFASRSTSQEALVDLIVQHHNGKLTWNVARRTGLFIWLEDKVALQTQLENLARNEFNKNDDRNPVDCSVYFLALNKKSVLQGLWRMTYGLREKENTMKLLANNFEEPRWKATAMKNAYALISKRRFEYAAAFFLLGGSLRDAVNLCVNQLHDVQLAIAITRVWDRDPEQSEKVLQDIVNKGILPMSVDNEQGRWMATWAYASLNQPSKAIQALVRPLHQVVGANLDKFDGPVKSMSYRANDPHLGILYTELRQDLVKQNKWTAETLSQKEEWDFVIRNARWWTRAGMDYLALRLLRDWQFVPHQTPRTAGAPTTLIVRANTLDDVSGYGTEETGVVEGNDDNSKKNKPAPTQFFEPSADSLLDSFGF